MQKALMQKLQITSIHIMWIAKLLKLINSIIRRTVTWLCNLYWGHWHLLKHEGNVHTLKWSIIHAHLSAVFFKGLITLRSNVARIHFVRFQWKNSWWKSWCHEFVWAMHDALVALWKRHVTLRDSYEIYIHTKILKSLHELLCKACTSVLWVMT